MGERQGQTERERDIQGEREIDRERERDRQAGTERERHTQTDIHGQRETDRQGQRESCLRPRNRHSSFCAPHKGGSLPILTSRYFTGKSERMLLLLDSDHRPSPS